MAGPQIMVVLSWSVQVVSKHTIPRVKRQKEVGPGEPQITNLFTKPKTRHEKKILDTKKDARAKVRTLESKSVKSSIERRSNTDPRQ